MIEPDTGVNQTVDDNLRVLAWVVEHLAARRHDEVRLDEYLDSRRLEPLLRAAR